MKAEEKLAGYSVITALENNKKNVGWVSPQDVTHQTETVGDAALTHPTPPICMIASVAIDLPEGWNWSTLGAVSEKPQYGWTTKANHESGKLMLLRTTDITSGSVDWSSVPYCTEEPEDVEKYLVESGDILISRAGSVGVSFLINKPERAVFASYLIRFRPKSGINTKYFYYYLKSPAYWDAIGASKAGIAVPNVNASKLAQVAIPVAPIDQQKRIVAEIEKQFSRLDKAVANLKRVKANLKRYKAAVLKAAVEGRLVETEAEIARREGRSYETGEQLLQCILETRRSQWKGKGKYKEPAAPDTTDLPELPQGWVWASTEQICRSVRDGTHDTPTYVDSGVPLITSKNLTACGIDFENVKLISEQDHTEISRRSGVENGDVLFAMIGTVGNPCEIKTDARFSIKNVGLFKRNPDCLNSAYLCYWLGSPLLNKWLEPRLKGTTQKFAPLGMLREIPVPYTSLAEQQRIVAEVDRHLSLANEAEAQVNANLKRAERLKQSILARAFTGNLTSDVI